MDILLLEQVKKCSRICTFLSNAGLAHPLFASFPLVSEKREKLTLLPSTHDLAVGFWATLRAEKLHRAVSFDIFGFILIKEQQVWLLASSFHCDG